MLSRPVFPADPSRDPEAFDRDRPHRADRLHPPEACCSGSQCRDAPAGTGEGENDEKTVDDGTVKFSLMPGGWHGAFCPFPFFRLGVLTLAQHSAVGCPARPGRRDWWKPTAGLSFIGKVILCLMSIGVFL